MTDAPQPKTFERSMLDLTDSVQRIEDGISKVKSQLGPRIQARLQAVREELAALIPAQGSEPQVESMASLILSQHLHSLDQHAREMHRHALDGSLQGLRTAEQFLMDLSGKDEVKMAITQVKVLLSAGMLLVEENATDVRRREYLERIADLPKTIAQLEQVIRDEIRVHLPLIAEYGKQLTLKDDYDVAEAVVEKSE